MKYTITHKIVARTTTEVEADSFEDAQKIVMKLGLCKGDFENMRIVDFRPVSAEDKDGAKETFEDLYWD